MTSPSRTWTFRHGRHLWLLVLAVVGGCASTSKTDALESRLRSQEDLLSSYQAQLDRAKTELDIARRESAGLRTQLAEGGTKVAAEHVEASFQAAEVAFSTLMTGGTDIDGRPGDDGLVVVLVPQDPNGELVKLPGTVEIEAFDLSHPSGAKRIGHWQFNAGESGQHWHKGVIQSGYQFELPWQQLPRSDEVLLHGRLVAPGGRQFDTTHTVRIDPPPTAVAEREKPVNLSTAIEQVSVDVNRAPAQSATGTGAAVSLPLPHDSPQSPTVGGGNSPLRPGGQSQHASEQESADRRLEHRPIAAGSASRPAEEETPPPLPSPRRPPVTSPQRPALSTADPWNGDFDAEIPPPIQDAPEASRPPFTSNRKKPQARPPVRSSDAWTEESLPYLR